MRGGVELGCAVMCASAEQLRQQSKGEGERTREQTESVGLQEMRSGVGGSGTVRACNRDKPHLASPRITAGRDSLQAPPKDCH